MISTPSSMRLGRCLRLAVEGIELELAIAEADAEVEAAAG